MYGFTPDHIPESYSRTDWFEMHERRPEDYGPPEGYKPDPTMPDYHDLEATRKWKEKNMKKWVAEGYGSFENSPEHLTAKIF